MDVKNRGFSIIYPLLILIIFVFLLNFKKVYAPGVFYHLKMGGIVAETYSPVRIEQFCFIKKGIKITHFEWLGDFILYKIYNMSGFTGLVIFKALICSLIFLLLFISLSKLTEHKISLLLLIILIAYGLRLFFKQTSIIFTLLFFSTLIAILTKEESRWFYTIPLIFLLWANIHPGFVFGLFYFLSFLAGLSYEFFIKKNNNKYLILLLIIFFISSGFTLVTPFGLSLYSKMIQLRVISDFIIKDEIPILKIFAVSFSFLLFLSILIVLLYYIKSIDKRYFLSFILLSWMPFYFPRTVSLLLLAGIPPCVMVINVIYNNNRVILQKILSVKTVWLSFKILPAIITIFILFFQYYTDVLDTYGAGKLNKFYPAGAIKFIKEHKLYGRWFNSIEFGGAIILDGSPEILPFIYSPTNFLSDIFNRYYMKFVKEPQALNDFLINNDVIGVIFMSGGDTTFAQHFEVLKSGIFAPVYWDDNSVVLIKRDLVDPSFLNRYELKFINPFSISSYLNYFLTSNEKIGQRLFDDIRASRERANGFALTHLLYGMALLNSGNYEGAESELRKSYDIQPLNIYTNMGLAILYQKLNKTDDYHYFQKRVRRLRILYRIIKIL